MGRIDKAAAAASSHLVIPIVTYSADAAYLGTFCVVRMEPQAVPPDRGFGGYLWVEEDDRAGQEGTVVQAR